MRKLKFTITLICLLTAKLWSTTYYVSRSGNNNNNGALATPWKTLTKAISVAVAGDLVYVKAGNYGTETVTFTKSGTSGSPITFQGYKTTPGDAPPVLVNNANPYAAFDTLDMPTFNGGNRAGLTTAFNCDNRQYLIIKNFQIQNHMDGVVAGTSNQATSNFIVLNNVNTMYMGKTSVDYDGHGILLGSLGTKFANQNTVTNCLVVNAASEAIGINGNNNTITGCKVYCNENTNFAPTDYYIIISGNYNTVTSCYVERAASLSHAGHGIGAKTNAEQVIDDPANHVGFPTITAQYNTFNYCTAKNLGECFYVRHRNARYNVFYHCKGIGTHTGSTEGEGECIVTRDGASDNTFDGCTAENCAAGIVFQDTSEDGDGAGSGTPGHPGNNNKYINCVINDCFYGVKFSSYSIQSDAGNNTIANCTFYKTVKLHEAQRHCANMKYIGNIYYGCLPSTPGGYFKGGTYTNDIVPNGTNTYFKLCDFINIEGGMPTNFVTNSVGSIASDPLFVNAGTGNFHLQSSSPCINKVDILSYNLKDFDDVARSTPKTTMGAFGTDLTSINMKNGIETSCSGTLYDDGGPSANYTDQKTYTLVIQPSGATSVTINFSEWAAEAASDILTIYNGSTTNSPVLGSWSGTSPGTVTANSGTMTLKFTSDWSTNLAGWKATWTSVGGPCSPAVVLDMQNKIETSCSGVLYDDGGPHANYIDAKTYTLVIQPAGATSVSINFSEWAAEAGSDILTIYNGSTTNSPLLGTWSGTSPGTVTANSGTMTLKFTSDPSTNLAGWKATWTSVGGPCSPVVLNMQNKTETSCAGTLYDEGGPNANYTNSKTYTLVIQPSGATSVSINFSEWNAEAGYDILTIYNGPTTASPLLGTWSGTNPGTVTANSGVMTVKFVSDPGTNGTGWKATWTSVGGTCSPVIINMQNATKTSCKGTLYDDGGPNANYTDSKTYTLVIQPSGATNVSINFSEWNAEATYDILTIYNGPTTASPLLGSWSGTSPGTVNANSGTMTVKFVSDQGTNGTGWKATWTSTGGTCGAGKPLSVLEDDAMELSDTEELNVFPNPTDGVFTVRTTKEFDQLLINNITGTNIYKQNVESTSFDVDLSGHAPGVYILQLIGNNKVLTTKIILK
jgi:hypothetical protein